MTKVSMQKPPHKQRRTDVEGTDKTQAREAKSNKDPISDRRNVDRLSSSGHDAVDYPKHYVLFDGEKQVIDLIKDRLTKDEFIGYLKGNMIKYHMRHQDKNGIEDIRKLNKYSAWYIQEVIK